MIAFLAFIILPWLICLGNCISNLPLSYNSLTVSPLYYTAFWQMAGYEFDYIFDWTIIKYQQAQKNRTQSRLSVSVFVAVCVLLFCLDITFFEILLLHVSDNYTSTFYSQLLEGGIVMQCQWRRTVIKVRPQTIYSLVGG